MRSPSGSRASPSMVVTVRSSQSTANIRHAHFERPSTMIVQAPHSPSPHAYFVPVRLKTSRSIASALIAIGTLARVRTPFSTNSISRLSDIVEHPSCNVEDELAPVPRRGAHVVDRFDLVARHGGDAGDGRVVEPRAFERLLGVRSAHRH